MSQSESVPNRPTTTSSAQDDQPPKEPAAAVDAEAQSPAADALERLRQRNSASANGSDGSGPASLPLEHAQTASQADALVRLKQINESLRSRAPQTSLVNTPQSEPSESDQAASFWHTAMPSSRIAKSLLALVAAVAIAWVPIQRLWATTSADATINARLINLRAPINGQVSIVAPTIAVGTPVKPGEPLLRITNARADRQRLDDMRRTLSNLKSEIAAQSKQLARFEEIRTSAQAQRDAFQLGRVRQLETRREELDAQLKAAEAHRDDALKSVNRVKSLNAKGYQPTATLLHAERDYKVSLNEVEAAQKRIEGNKIELDAARKGLFVGDSYNDLPRSAQRLDELDQRLADLSSDLEQRRSRVAHLTSEIAAETALFDARSAADVVATVDGRIWESLTANGEEVRSGQDLLRVLDCGSATVTATVSEPVYNTLWIGQPVTFELHGESRQYTGTVAALTGLAAAGSNFAIKQTALKREPYHVTISVPDLAAQQRCNVGRSGQVAFDTSSRTPSPSQDAQPATPGAPGVGAPSNTPTAATNRGVDFGGSMRNALQNFATGLGYP